MSRFSRCWSLVLLATCAVAQTLPPIPTDVGAALDAMPVQAAVEGGARVSVLLGGEPVAEADVFVIDRARILPHMDALLKRDGVRERGSDYWNSLLALWVGVRYRAGADGAVSVAVPASGSTVFARGRSTYGAASLHAGQGAVPVTVRRRHEVRIQVQDARGRALADAPVTLAWRAQNSVSRRPVGRTDAEGLLVATVDDEPARELVASVDCIGAAPVDVPVPRRADGTCAPLTLTAPPTGMVRVIAYDDAERPRSGVRDVRLHIAGAARDLRRPEGFAPHKLEPEGATFRWVALGQTLRARVTFAEVVGELTVEGPGPVHAGELVVLTLRSKVAEPVLHVRVLDQRGEPLRDTKLTIVRGTEQSCSTIAVTTGPDGHLDFALPEDWRTAAERGLLLVRRGVLGQVPTEYLGAVDVTALAAQPPRERVEVRLREEPEMLRGRVLDGEGRPLGDVVVQVAYSWSSPRLGQLGGFSTSGDVFLGHQVKTDADGRFAVRELAPKDVLLTVDAPQAKPALAPAEVVRAAPGRTDVTLTLLRAGSLTVELPGWPAGVRLQASLRQGDRVHASQGVEADGRLAFTGVPPGKWTVVFHSLHSLADVELRDIDVPAGKASTDPRLRIADWRERVVVVDTKVTSPEGLPLDVSVSIRVEKPGLSSTTSTSSTGGRVLLAVPRDATRVTLSHQQYQSVDLEVKSPQADVQMRPRGLVRFKLREGVSLPEGLDLMIHYAQRNTAESTKWPKGRTLECAAPGPGGVTFMVLLRSEIAPRQFANRSLWQTSLTIKPDRATQDIELDLTPEDAERITELLREARQAETETKRAGK